MEASPICRGQNITLETVLCFLYAMPKNAMSKSEFNSYAESRMKGWTQTHSQIARQMALYYEDGGICYPRFISQVDLETIVAYVKHWARLYFVPNPYTPSLFGLQPTNIYAFLKESILRGKTNFTKACNSIFKDVSLNNLDKVRVYLTNFTDILVDNDKMYANGSLLSADEIVYPKIETLSAKDYFLYFGGAIGGDVVKGHYPMSLQQIFYGAPGTGKSHRIDGKTNDDNSIRTTFHPDTDYATFVGAYKPMMEETEVRVVPVVLNNGASFDQNNGTYKEKRIVYKYEPQVFLKAYVEAWKRFLTKQEGEDDSFYLVIEEINRGNCAQIFGDLFQLLDREDDGFSGYAISPESAITKYLAEEAQSADGTKFSDLVFSDVIKKRKDGATKIIATADDLKAGKRLVLPPNLHIWATMNTSDQSLFPIDSAFKRRWDWEYVPIKRADKEPENKWIIKVTHGGKTYWCYWWEFLEAINHQIEETTHSEDKQLGYFFAKPKNGEDFISTDTFVNKVIFYLWNDVFKDEDSAVFQYDNDKVEDVSISRSGTMYFRHFMENKDEMIHYFINQLFAMGKDSTPVVPIDYLKNDADSKVIEHLPKMREGDPVKLDDEAVDEETSEDNGISVRKSDNIDKIVFSIPEYKKMSEKLTQALKGNVFKYSKNSMDMKMGDMPISYARLSMAYSSKKTDIKLYIPSKSAYNQSIECYKYMNSKGVEDIIAEVSERNNLEYELISKDIAENKVLGWRIKYPMTFSESADNIMDGDVTKIVEIVKELQKRITPIMNEFSKNGK